MLDINAMLQKAIREEMDTSIMVNTTKPEKAKITIEIPGQDTIVLDSVDEFMVCHRLNNHLAMLGTTSLPFLIIMFKILQEKIDKAICNKLGLNS